MYILHQKIKRVSKDLSQWSKEIFVDIYETPKQLEEEIKILEDSCVINNILENRSELSRCKVEFIRYLKIQNSILRQ